MPTNDTRDPDADRHLEPTSLEGAASWWWDAPCNNRCRVCLGSEGPSGGRDAAPAPHAGRIELRGGEPGLNPELLQRLSDCEAAPRLWTNGRLYSSPQQVARVREAGVDAFVVTLLGHRAEAHDYLARCEGAFVQSIAGVRRLVASGATVTLRLLVTRQSYRALEPFVALAIALEPADVTLAVAELSHPSIAAVDARRALPRLTLLLPYLKDALDQLVRAGVSCAVSGVPPCLLEGYEAFVGDRPGRRPGHFGAGCESCALRPHCAGLTSRYAALYGDGELQPTSRVAGALLSSPPLGPALDGAGCYRGTLG